MMLGLGKTTGPAVGNVASMCRVYLSILAPTRVQARIYKQGHNVCKSPTDRCLCVWLLEEIVCVFGFRKNLLPVNPCDVL